MNLKTRIGNSRLAQDSLWAVCGNGLGYGLLLIAGIIIANFLRADVYGEYGLVKVTMLYIAGFATLGLGISSTKFIANALKEEYSSIKSLARDAMQITLIFSTLLASLLVVFAIPLAHFLKEPGLVPAFRVLGAIVICKALNSTQNGILAGFGDFRAIAQNNVASGLLMLGSCIPLTYFYKLDGAFVALFISQAFNAVLNWLSLRKRLRTLKRQKPVSRKKDLVLFSFPIALQELNYTVCSWGGIALLTKLSSVGQVGIYTAVNQWNGVITFIPGLLSNVVLSHLSGTTDNVKAHRHTLMTMLGVNFITTLLPFLIVFALADWITDTFYGPSFVGMGSVFRVMTLATVFSACSVVLYSELISYGHNWISLICRILQESTLFFAGWFLLLHWRNQAGAFCFATAYLISAIISFLAPLVCLFIFAKKN